MTATSRRTLLVMIHAARRTLALDDESYRALLERLTGKRSCRDLNGAELQRVVDHFRAEGAIPERTSSPYPGGSGELDDRPTEKQWGTITFLVTEAGYSGLDDPRFADFLRRTAHVDSARFLDLARASDVISGLVQVARWRNRK